MVWNSKNQGYYFCSDPDCSVVYFGRYDSVINSDSLRTIMGIKSQSGNDLFAIALLKQTQEMIQ